MLLWCLSAALILEEADPECPSSFTEAVKSNDVTTLEDALAANPNMEDCQLTFTVTYKPKDRKSPVWFPSVDKVHGTPLHRAAYDGSSKLIPILLNYGFTTNAPVAKPKADGFFSLRFATPLILAAYSGSAEAVRELLKAPDIQVNAADKHGVSALSHAAERGNVEVVHVLLAAKGVDVNLGSKAGKTALMMASEAGRDQVVELLWEADGIDANKPNQDNWTALIFAASNGHIQVVKRLLQVQNIDVNVEDNFSNKTALVRAYQGHHMEVVTLLLSLDDIMVEATDKVIEQLLLADVINVNHESENGNTPLTFAARHGHIEVVKLLLQSPDIRQNRAGKDGKSPLIFAVMNGHKEVVKLLLSTPRINLGRVDLESETALTRAAKLPDYEVADMLLKSDALNLNAADEAGWMLLTQFSRKHRGEGAWSPLRAALRGHLALVMLLIHSGASWDEDIDKEDLEAHKLAVWLGVKYSLMKLLKHAIGIRSWSALSALPTSNCLENMKGKCHFTLLTLAETAHMVHWLLDWQARDASVSVAARNAQAKNALIDALKQDKSTVAHAFLSRGIGNNIDVGALVAAKEVNFAGTDWQRQLEAWNLFHWTGHSCDAALTQAFTKSSDRSFLALLDVRPQTGEANVDKTPMQIVEENRLKCPEHFAAFQTLKALAADMDRTALILITSFGTTIVVCTRGLASSLFFLRLQTMRSHGVIFMAVSPTIFCLSGLLIAHLDWSFTEGNKDLDFFQRGLGYLAAMVGGVLLLGVCGACWSTRFVHWLQRVKKRGTDKMERCWEKGDSVTHWFLVFVLTLQVFTTLGSGIGTLVIGVLHALASTLPLYWPSCRGIALPMRLAPGLFLMMVVLYFTIHPHSHPSFDGIAPHSHSPLVMVTPSALLLVATCLALAWGDVPGTYHSVLQTVQKVVEIEMVAQEAVSEKFTANKLILGRGAAAAHGIQETLGLTEAQLREGLQDPLGAMRKEVLASGDQNDLENFDYIVNGMSNRAEDLPRAVAESLKTGIYHGGSIGPNDFDTGHDGRKLAEWMQVDEVVLSKLTEAEFVAVRFYTSSSFPRINGPLRKQVQPHPWAMVVYHLDRGIKKLRSVQAQVNPEEFASQTVLWRGMKNLEVDIKEFAALGGTEMAPMSTTTNEEVARHYATSQVPLVFKYVVGGLKTGVSIRFLSLYPKEEEFLYAPLTFLSLKRHYEDDGTTILVVEPVMS